MYNTCSLNVKISTPFPCIPCFIYFFGSNTGKQKNNFVFRNTGIALKITKEQKRNLNDFYLIFWNSPLKIIIMAG